MGEGASFPVWGEGGHWLQGGRHIFISLSTLDMLLNIKFHSLKVSFASVRCDISWGEIGHRHAKPALKLNGYHWFVALPPIPAGHLKGSGFCSESFSSRSLPGGSSHTSPPPGVSVCSAPDSPRSCGSPSAQPALTGPCGQWPLSHPQLRPSRQRQATPLSRPLRGGCGRILKASRSLRSPATLTALLLCSATNGVYSLLPAPCWVGVSKGVPFAPNLWAEKQLSKSNRKSKVTRRVVEIGFELATLRVHQGSPGRSCVSTSFKGKKMCCQKYTGNRSEEAPGRERVPWTASVVGG